MDQIGAIKSQILWGFFYFYLLYYCFRGFEFIVRSQEAKYRDSKEVVRFMSQTGAIKSQILCFRLISHLLLVLEVFNVSGGSRIPDLGILAVRFSPFI